VNTALADIPADLQERAASTSRRLPIFNGRDDVWDLQARPDHHLQQPLRQADVSARLGPGICRDATGQDAGLGAWDDCIHADLARFSLGHETVIKRAIPCAWWSCLRTPAPLEPE